MVGVFVKVDYSVFEWNVSRYCRNDRFPGFSCVSRLHVLAMREEEEDVAARCLVGSLGLRLATSTSLRMSTFSQHYVICRSKNTRPT